MRKTLWITAGILSLTGLAWVQVSQVPPRALSSLMPSGPLIYLEAKDFHSVLTEWNQSGVKRAWLSSANYKVFSNSNLLQKLNSLYQEYGAVAGFLPGLPGTLEIAGRESALGLYDLPSQQFVYVTRVDESQLTKSQLWRLREKFTLRQANGIQFYLRRDDASNRTVAFAFTHGFLVLATRDDLMANTLALIAEQASTASLSGEPWFPPAVSQAGAPGELRLILDMQSLIGDVHFRSYWIQRNVSDLRPFNAEVVDLQRSAGEIIENRVLVRRAEAQIAPPAQSTLDAVAALRTFAPPDAALIRAWAAPTAIEVESLIEGKLLQPGSETALRGEYAPDAADTESGAGSEQDLETRIDEPALPNTIGGILKSAALNNLIAQAAPEALMQVQSGAAAGAFVRTPCVLVVSSSTTWDAVAIREALSSAVETLWSTSRLGVGWQPATLGQHTAEQLNGLAVLLFAIDGRHLFLANDSALLQATLTARAGTLAPGGPAYLAEIRIGRERADYMKIMQALDFTGRAQSFVFDPQGPRTPALFSENLGSLSGVLSFVQEVSVTRSETAGTQRQQVIYR